MINLHCPSSDATEHSAIHSPFEIWSDVPEWWPCSCGLLHYKTDPFKTQKRCEATSNHPKLRCEMGEGHEGAHYAQIGKISEIMWKDVKLSRGEKDA